MNDAMLIPIRTGRGMNDRKHPMVRYRTNRVEQDAVGWILKGVHRPKLPTVCKLTRIAPGNGLDDDNLQGSLKAIRDAIALWLAVDDKHREVVRYEYQQERGPWGVRVEFESAEENRRTT